MGKNPSKILSKSRDKSVDEIIEEEVFGNKVALNKLRSSLKTLESHGKKDFLKLNISRLLKKPMRFSTQKQYNNFGGEFSSYEKEHPAKIIVGDRIIVKKKSEDKNQSIYPACLKNPSAYDMRPSTGLERLLDDTKLGRAGSRYSGGVSSQGDPLRASFHSSCSITRLKSTKS